MTRSHTGLRGTEGVARCKGSVGARLSSRWLRLLLAALALLAVGLALGGVL